MLASPIVVQRSRRRVPQRSDWRRGLGADAGSISVTVPIDDSAAPGQLTLRQKLSQAAGFAPPQSAGNGASTTIVFTPNTSNMWPGVGYYTVTFDDPLHSRTVITAAQFSAAMNILNQYGNSPAPPPAGLPVESFQYVQGVRVAAPSVTPSGQLVSTQTGSGVSLASVTPVASGVYQCTYSNGTHNYCDASGNPISYSPPVSQPAVTPPPVQTSAQPAPAPPVPQNYIPVAVSPSGTPVNTVTGAPAAAVPAPASAVSAGFDFNSIWAWLQGSMFGGIPNWILVAGGAALFLFSGEEKGHRRR